MLNIRILVQIWNAIRWSKNHLGRLLKNQEVAGNLLSRTFSNTNPLHNHHTMMRSFTIVAAAALLCSVTQGT